MLEIGLKVDSRQVLLAKAHVRALAGALDDTFSQKYAIEIAGLKGMGGGTAAAGKAQMDAGNMDKVGKSATVYRREMETTGKVVSTLVKDFDKLIKGAATFKLYSGPRDANRAPESYVSPSAREMERSHAASKAAAQAFNDSVSQQKRQTWAERNGVAQGRGTPGRPDDPTDGTGGASGRNNGQWMRKAMGWGAAAVGVGTIAGFIGASRSAYRSALDEESPLWARGLTGARGRASKAAGMGIAPGEYYGLEDQLSRNTGLNEKNMPRSAMLSASFARFGGLETSEVGGLRSSIYQATGSNTRIPDAVLFAMGESVKKGMDKARMPELLGMIGRNTGATAAAMHGAGVSSSQIGALTGLSTAALGLKDGTSYKQFAKSGEFMSVLQNGMQGSAGTPAGDIQLFSALGGFKGKMSFEKIHEMNLIKQGGFLKRPDLLQGIIGGMSGSKAARAGQLETMYSSWGINGAAADSLIGMNDSGFLKRLSGGKSIESMAKGGDKEAARWLEEIKNNPALGRQATEATKDLVKIEAGEKLSKLFEPMELAAAKFTGALVDGEWKKSFDIFGRAAGEMGPVSKTLLAAGGLFAAGGALSFAGGAAGLAGKAGGGALIGSLLTGPGGLLAALGLGAVGAHAIFKDGAQGANYLPADRLNAITGKPMQTAFGGKLNSGIANDPRFSKGYKTHAVKIHEASKRYGVPENLLSGLIESESDFKNVPGRIIDLKGGKHTTVGGIGQFTEETAKRYKINRMDPGQAIDGAARLLADNFKRTGDWRVAVKDYKGVISPENNWQVDTAFKKAEKYTNSEAERQALQQAGGTSDPTMQMIASILQVIAGHSEQTSANTAIRPMLPTILPLPR